MKNFDTAQNLYGYIWWPWSDFCTQLIFYFFSLIEFLLGVPTKRSNSMTCINGYILLSFCRCSEESSNVPTIRHHDHRNATDGWTTPANRWVSRKTSAAVTCSQSTEHCTVSADADRRSYAETSPKLTGEWAVRPPLEWPVWRPLNTVGWTRMRTNRI